MLRRVNPLHKEPRMSTRTARRRLRIASALIAATLVTPSVASAAMDLRGEYAKAPGIVSLATAGTDLRSEYAKGPGTVSQVAAGTDLRSEFAQAPDQLAAAAPGADVRGEFAKPE